MSYKATAWAYELELRGPAKPVLVALADFADEAGSCYPGQERLCSMTGLSIRTIRRALERLETMGLLTRERRFDQYGHRTSDRYYLQLDIQSLPATVTGGQTDRRSESPSLPVRESIPTGHSDRVTISRTTRDPSGGPRTAPTPQISSPTCSRHPDGTDRPCSACKRARIAWDAAPATLAAPARKPVKHIPGLCDDHRQREGECEACAYENAHAAEIIRGVFEDIA